MDDSWILSYDLQAPTTYVKLINGLFISWELSLILYLLWSGFYKLNLYMVICRKIIELHVLKSGSIDHFDKV